VLTRNVLSADHIQRYAIQVLSATLNFGVTSSLTSSIDPQQIPHDLSPQQHQLDEKTRQNVNRELGLGQPRLFQTMSANSSSRNSHIPDGSQYNLLTELQHNSFTAAERQVRGLDYYL